MEFYLFFLDLSQTNILFLEHVVGNPFSLSGVLLSFGGVLFSLWPTIIHRVPFRYFPDKVLRLLVLIGATAVLVVIGLFVH